MHKSCALVILTLLLGLSAADARRSHHRHVRLLAQDVDVAVAPDIGDRGGSGRTRAGQDDVTNWLPPGWQLQPADPDWKGRRYVSPDGFAKLAIFSTEVGKQGVMPEMRDFAFVDGEQISYLRGERDWIVASGSKDNHVFYRKASLACGGKIWHRIEFEYPFEDKVKLDNLVSQFSRRLDLYKGVGCGENVSRQ